MEKLTLKLCNKNVNGICATPFDYKILSNKKNDVMHNFNFNLTFNKYNKSPCIVRCKWKHFITNNLLRIYKQVRKINKLEKMLMIIMIVIVLFKKY